MTRGYRRGEPTPLFDLMERASDYTRKVEVIQKVINGEHHITDGQKGLAGAMLLKYADSAGLNKTVREIAEVFGLKPDTVQSAQHILRAGTPQEIVDVRDGLRGINNLARVIQRRSPAQKSDYRDKKGINSRGGQIDRLRLQQERSEIWQPLRAALDGLTSLPLAETVSAEIRKSYWMNKLTDEKLDRALKWLKDFADAYRTQQGHQGQEGGEAAGQVEAGDDRSDPGTSGRAA